MSLMKEIVREETSDINDVCASCHVVKNVRAIVLQTWKICWLYQNETPHEVEMIS